ncbi:MAG: XRE family transcriptional regulator [Tractidigestivibacter sp.]|uniref:XRE family transcriptional regulator n=1 Tax=Tractidigestivibacter sp. TaxID=2847320 RepID=UPI003D90AC3C
MPENTQPEDAESLQLPEHLTEELLMRLLESSSPDEYLEEGNFEERTLSQYLNDLLDQGDLRKSEVIRASGVSPTFCYQVFQGTRMPGRDNAIMIAFGLGCSLVETQRLLRLAGVSELWSRNRRDAIIIFCIEHGKSREQCDDELWRLGEETLLDGE